MSQAFRTPSECLLREIPLPPDGVDPSRLYFGAIDPAATPTVDHDIVTRLKFAALFFESIVVADGWFHAEGPLHQHMKRLLGVGGAVWDDPFVMLLKAQILVPALREGSLYETWANGRAGVVPGEYLTLDKKEGEITLPVWDQHITRYYRWPDALNSSGKVASAFGLALHRALQSGVDAITFPEFVAPPRQIDRVREARLATDLLSEFYDVVVSRKSDPSFRRGDVENLIKARLGLPETTSYAQLKWTTDGEPSLLRATSSYILDLAATAQQAFYARHFGAAGGLLPDHEDSLIDAGLLDEYAQRVALNRAVAYRPARFGSLDVARVPITEILGFRGTAPNYSPIFSEYLRRVRTLKPAHPGAAFQAANEEFVRFLCESYVPAIFRMCPTAGVLGRLAPAANQVEKFSKGTNALVAVLLGTNFIATTVAGHPLHTWVVASAGVTLAANSVTAAITKRLVSRRGRRRFAKKNNYSV